MSKKTSARTLRSASLGVLIAVTFTLVAGFVPASVAAEATTSPVTFRSLLSAQVTASRVSASDTAATPISAWAARARTATAIAPVIRTASTNTRTVNTGSNAVAAAPAGDELSEARSILAGYIAKYPILAGTTISFGDARGYQAISYYQSGRIVISTGHTASLQRIIGHEIWHVIDWRDNGVIDWGENVPPQ